MSTFRTARTLALALVLLAMLVPVAALAYLTWQKHLWAQNRLSDLEPRYARLLGLDSQRADLSKTLERAHAARALYLYPATQDAAQAGNAAQQRLRDILTASGLQVSSSQVLASKTDKDLDRIPLSVRAEGTQLALQSALAVISSQSPVILIQELEVQMMGGSPTPYAPPRLSVQFGFVVLKERS